MFRSQKIISFSEEIKQILISERKWKQEDIIVCAARHNLNPLLPPESFTYIPSRDFFRIAWLSRLNIQKRNAFKHFMNSLSGCSEFSMCPTIKVDIFGDGDDSANWHQIVSESHIPDNVLIEFKGPTKVTGDFLGRFDLVIAQGRGVIEALVSGTPVAICGENGYAGLVTTNNFDEFARTNFTGRGIDHVQYSSLNSDLANLYSSTFQDQVKYLQNISAEIFDVNIFAELIENITLSSTERIKWIPNGGSISRCIINNFLCILKSAIYRIRS